MHPPINLSTQNWQFKQLWRWDAPCKNSMKSLPPRAKDVAVGIGINTGDCVVGNVRINATVATLCSATPLICFTAEGQSGEYGFQIIAGANCQIIIRLWGVRTGFTGGKGPKTEPVTIYLSLMALRATLMTPSFQSSTSEFLKAYRGQD